MHSACLLQIIIIQQLIKGERTGEPLLYGQGLIQERLGVRVEGVHGGGPGGPGGLGGSWRGFRGSRGSMEGVQGVQGVPLFALMPRLQCGGHT